MLHLNAMSVRSTLILPSVWASETQRKMLKKLEMILGIIQDLENLLYSEKLKP